MTPEPLKAGALVALQIYEWANIKKEIVYYGKLLDSFDGRIPDKEVSKSIDFLFDICMIDAEYENVNRKWVRSIKINLDYLPYMEELYKKVSEV